MNFLYKMERRFGKYAIPQLMRKILFGQAIVFLLTLLTGNRSLQYLFMFDRSAILDGEIWRLVTFIFVPDNSSPLLFILFIMVYMSIADNLEQVWGSFNFNVYYFVSMLAALIVSFIFNISGPIAYYIHLSLFLSFATLVPEATFMLYFIIPVKAKYLIVFYFVILGFNMLSGGLPTFALITASLLGYLIFLGIPALRKYRMRGKVRQTQKQFKEFKREQNQVSREPIKVAFHKCTVCGITELDNPEMEFRYCSKCNGHHEYCMDHLKNHQHIE